MVYQPDNWIVLKIHSDDLTVYKVLGGWSGGYLDGDSWRMNSGISKVEVEGDHYLFRGYSGSTYKCHKGTYGIRMNIAGIYESLLEQAKSSGINVEMLRENANWLELL
jgi:hypothetical protein